MISFTRSQEFMLRLVNRQQLLLFFEKHPRCMSTKVQGDEVVSPRFFDNTPMHRAFILQTMFVFDDVLKSSKLLAALESVIQRGNWRRLGARLRRNTDGKLEYHIPASFDQYRPAVEFSHVDHRMPLAFHPIGSKLPKRSSKVATLAKSDDFQALSGRTDSPRSLDDYINRPRPQIGLHVESFTDATLVSLHSPHNLLDGMGIIALLNAWTLALQGRHDEIPETYNIDVDPLADLGRYATEKHKLSKHLMSLMDIVKYGLRNFFQLLKPDLERRIICVPASFMSHIRAKALKDLQSNIKNEKEIFLSEGDVLCAWWTRVCASAQLSRNSDRTVAFYNTQSLKAALSGNLLRHDRPYLGNAFQLVPILCNATSLLQGPLGISALQIRQTTKELSSRGQVEAFAALWRASPFKLVPLFGDAGMLVVTCSNWTKAKFFEVDFSAAIFDQKEPNPRPPNSVGKPLFVYHNRLGSDALIGPNVLIIMGKDGDGNYWLDACTRRKHWNNIEKILSKSS